MSATVIIGKHAVKGVLASDQHVEKLYLRQRQKINEDLNKMIVLAKKKRIHLQWLEPYKFDQRFSGDHQGIACIIHSFSQGAFQILFRINPRWC